jgi:hypothetical protein
MFTLRRRSAGFARFASKPLPRARVQFFYRLRSDPTIVMYVIILLAYSCPVQAIVKAFGLDERTVRAWHARGGKHCQKVHEHFVENSQQDLQQVQADEINAIVAKLTDHQWTPVELFTFKVPPPRWKLPALHGRPSKALLQLAQQWVA